MPSAISLWVFLAMLLCLYASIQPDMLAMLVHNGFDALSYVYVLADTLSPPAVVTNPLNLWTVRAQHVCLL